MSRSRRYSPVVADQYPVPLASLRSVARVSIPAAPASFQVSQSWGSATAAVRSAAAGSLRANQRSFVTVKEETGTTPTASAQARSPAPSAPSSARRSSAA